MSGWNSWLQNRRVRYWLLFTVILAAAFYYAHLLRPVAERALPAFPEYREASKGIQTAVGRPLALVLDSNPSTGYHWQLSKPLDPSLVKVIEIKRETKRNAKLGEGGTEKWVLQVLKPGFLSMTFHYVRPWEKDVPPVREMVFEITAY